MASRSERVLGFIQCLLYLGTRIVRLPVLMPMWKRFWNLTSRLGFQLVKKRTVPVLAPNSSVIAAFKDQDHDCAIERKTAREVQAKSCDVQAEHRTSLRAELNVLEALSISDLPPGHSAGPEFVNHVPHKCIPNCHVLLGLCNEASEKF